MLGVSFCETLQPILPEGSNSQPSRTPDPERTREDDVSVHLQTADVLFNHTAKLQLTRVLFEQRALK